MKSLVLAIVLATILAQPVLAQEKAEQSSWQVTLTHWQEGGPKHFAFAFERVRLDNPAYGRVEVQAFTDRKRAGLRQLWVGSPQLRLTVPTSWVRVGLSPGLILNNHSQLQAGADATVVFPTLHLSLVQRSYWGRGVETHLSFVHWQPTKAVGLLYHLNAARNRAPEAYLGPSFKLGPVTVEGGPSLTRRGAWLLSTQAAWKF